jgi:hypothetical protein
MEERETKDYPSGDQHPVLNPLSHTARSLWGLLLNEVKKGRIPK